MEHGAARVDAEHRPGLSGHVDGRGPRVRHQDAQAPGTTLEATQAGREDRLALIPPKLELLRTALRDTPWLGGESPNYTDYRALAVFLFMAAVATTPVLTEDDPIRDWIDRGFDLYGGLGRHPGLHPLFGLKLRDGDPEPFVKTPLMNGLVKRNTGPDSTREETERFKARLREASAERV